MSSACMSLRLILLMSESAWNSSCAQPRRGTVLVSKHNSRDAHATLRPPLRCRSWRRGKIRVRIRALAVLLCLLAVLTPSFLISFVQLVELRVALAQRPLYPALLAQLDLRRMSLLSVLSLLVQLCFSSFSSSSSAPGSIRCRRRSPSAGSPARPRWALEISIAKRREIETVKMIELRSLDAHLLGAVL